jgi:NADPH:quinone reductase-like Zn-dependent oxidoreductase
MKTEREYWDHLLQLYPTDRYSCTLIDDNAENIALVRTLGMVGLRINAGRTFGDCLIDFMVNISSFNQSSPVPFQFDEIEYLAAKNRVDAESFNSDVWNKLKARLSTHLKNRSKFIHDIRDTIAIEMSTTSIDRERTEEEEGSLSMNVLDLGCGQLNMLERIVELVGTMNKESQLSGGEHELPSPVATVHYVAIESNARVVASAISKLLDFNMVRLDSPLLDATEVARFSGTLSGVRVLIDLCDFDFQSEKASKVTAALLSNSVLDSIYSKGGRLGFDLIVGACVADLYDPSEFVSRIIELAGDRGGLLYLPITFNGQTLLRVSSTVDGGTTVNRNDDRVEESHLYPSALQSRVPTAARLQTSNDHVIAADANLSDPSGDIVFDTYHKHLKSMGHHIDAHTLCGALESHGCRLVTASTLSDCSSDWRISRQTHPYMWRSMLHFILHGTCCQLFDQYDMQQWVRDVCSFHSPTDDDLHFVVRNVDILAELPVIERYIHHPNASDDSISAVGYKFSTLSQTALRHQPPYHLLDADDRGSVSSAVIKNTRISLQQQYRRQAVEFIAPEVLHVVEEDIPALKGSQLRIRTECSLISTGTELKIFRGELLHEDDDEPLDATLTDMKDCSLKYPLRYGYSLVGVVEQVGADLRAEEWVGKRVFAFSPHTSVAVLDATSVQIIPEGVSFEDAVFLPSVETAVSLVMAALPMLGERVAVVGQGLIGQLTAAVVRSMMPSIELTVFDVVDEKLSIGKQFFGGDASNVRFTNPKQVEPTSQRQQAFDVCVEVSGSISGLQLAIDSTIAGGRVVIGSWYSSSSETSNSNRAALRLGTRFHRSGIQLITSQVSSIPATISDRWDKARRFNTVWGVIRICRPSRLLRLGGHVVAISRPSDVLSAYKALSSSNFITALLDYNT